MDFVRVYNSDMKKIIKWYQQLITNNIEIKLSEHEEGEEATPAAEAVTAKAKPIANTKAAAAKAAPPKKINSPRKMA